MTSAEPARAGCPGCGRPALVEVAGPSRVRCAGCKLGFDVALRRLEAGVGRSSWFVDVDPEEPPPVEVRDESCPERFRDLRIGRGSTWGGMWSRQRPSAHLLMAWWALALGDLALAALRRGAPALAAPLLVLAVIQSIRVPGRPLRSLVTRRQRVLVADGRLTVESSLRRRTIAIASILDVRVAAGPAGRPHVLLRARAHPTRVDLAIGRGLGLSPAALVWIARHLQTAADRLAPERRP